MNIPDGQLSVAWHYLPVTMILQPEGLEVEWPHNVEISCLLMGLFAYKQLYEHDPNLD